MNLEELRRCQLIQLDALKFIDRICRDNQLRYFVHTGTLLGAIRHNGYIPWDMDTDILMPEKDVKKLMKLVEEMNSPKYSIISQYESWASSDRLISKAALCYGSAAINEEDRYIHIDIYSYNNAKRHLSLLDKYYNSKSRIINRLIEYRMGRTIFRSNMTKNMIQLVDYLLRGFTNKQLKMSLKLMATQKEDSDNISVYNSFYGFAKETYPKLYFKESILVPFEDMCVPVPKHYEEVLTKLYGNWRQLPPESERYPKYINEMVYKELKM